MQLTASLRNTLKNTPFQRTYEYVTLLLLLPQQVRALAMLLLSTVRKQKVLNLGVLQSYNFHSRDPDVEMGATEGRTQINMITISNARKESRLGTS